MTLSSYKEGQKKIMLKKKKIRNLSLFERNQLSDETNRVHVEVVKNLKNVVESLKKLPNISCQSRNKEDIQGADQYYYPSRKFFHHYATFKCC